MQMVDATGKKNIMQILADMKKGGKSDTKIDRKEEAQAILTFAREIIQKKEFDNSDIAIQSSVLADALESLGLLKYSGVKQVLDKLNELSQQLRYFAKPEYTNGARAEGIISDALNLIL